MKEQKEIRHIEWNIGYKWIRRQKRYCLLLLCIAVLACTLLQLGCLVTDGMTDALAEQRKNIYGEWEYGLTDMDSGSVALIQENPFISYKGIIRIYGVLAGAYAENKQSNLGTIDQTAWQLGHLQMLKGRLPENEQEIAMESSTLTAMGYEGAVGEQIALDVIHTTDFQDGMSGERYTYTLCGVIKDYQINWDICNQNRFPTGILTEVGAKKIGMPLETHMLIQTEKGNASVYEDLKKSKKMTCGMEENEKWNQDVSDQIPYMKFLRSVRILIAGATACILYLVVSDSVRKRKEMWKILAELGMERSQMYRILMCEAAVCYMISALSGIITGTILYQLWMPLWKYILGYALIKEVSWQSCIQVLLYSLLIFVISYIFSCMKLNKDSKGGMKYQIKKSVKREAFASRLTPLSVVLREWNYRKVQKTIQILLLTGTVAMCGIGYLEIRSGWEELAKNRQYTGDGYLLEAQPDSRSKGIASTTVQMLSQIKGVKSVEIYDETLYEELCTVDLSEYRESPYVQKIAETEQFFQDYVDVRSISLNAMGVEKWEQLQRFLADVQEGEVTEEQFESGEYCILMLPPLRKQDGVYLPWNIKETVRKGDIQDESIKVGDELTVNCQGKEPQQIKIRVDAIIRASSEKNMQVPYPASSGITMITGKNFWKWYNPEKYGKYCQKVKIQLDDTADAYDTEKHILSSVKKAGNINLINYHEIYAEQRQTCYSVTATFIIFAIFYVIMTVIVVSQLSEAERKDRARNHQIWIALGMEHTFFKKMQHIEVAMECGLALAAGAIVTIGYYVMK